MANYPDSIYSPRTKKNRAGITYDPSKETVIFVEDIKKLDDEIVAVETELGTIPKDGYNSVKEALKDLLLNKIPFTAKGDLGVAVGPVGHWKMNDNADNKTVADASGLGNNGTAQQNTNVLTTAGKINTALSFNGASDKIDLGYPSWFDFTHATPYTLSLWVYLQEIGSEAKYQGLLAHSQRHGLAIHDTSRRIYFGMRSSTDSSYIKVSNETVPLQTWTHLIVTHNPITKKITLYKNGVEVDSIVHNLSNVARNGAYTWIMGYDSIGGTTKFFNGKTDDVRIYNKCLTAYEAAKIYNEGNGTEYVIPVVRVLPVGSDGQILKVDSTKPEGISWVTP